MANRPISALILRASDRDELERMTRSQSMLAGMVQPARIVLMASEGRRNAEIAELAGASPPKVKLWRSRDKGRGLAGMVDEKRSGLPPTIDHAQIVTATLMPPPKSLGVTHCSFRTLAARLRISASTGVASIVVALAMALLAPPWIQNR